MAKYSYEFKEKVVQAYLNGEGSYEFLSDKYGIASSKCIKEWVKAYEFFGDDGLMRSRQKKTYTFNFKKNVVELYLTTEISYQELALSLGMNNPSLIVRWVNNYRIAGLDALKPRQKGRRPKMAKPKNTKKPISADESTNSEYLKQLEEENLRLRIENAYLKEVRRLNLEGKTLREQRESSTVSEKHSN
jgi:transposase